MQEWVQEEFKDIRAPFTAGIELTANCNLNCIHCYAKPSRGHKDITFDEIKALLESMTSQGLVELFYTGGEVFLRPDFEDIYLYTKRQGIIVSLLSNLTTLKQHHIDLFKEYPVSQISTTMYGASEDTYERVTGSKAAYRKFLSGIELLKTNNIPFEIKFIGMEQNIDDIQKVRKFVDELGVNLVVTFSIRPSYDLNKAPVGLRVSAERAFEFDSTDHMRRAYLEDAAKTLFEIRQGIQEKKNQSRLEERCLYPCDIARQFVFITSDCKMQGCATASVGAYDLRTGSFEEGWEYLKQEFVEKKATEQYQCLSCDMIEYCDHCTARWVLEYGDPEKPDPFFCNIGRKRMKFIEERVDYLGGA
jgi:radical SAM protein with 4Fe4S-binding SPASM domain